VSSVTHQTIKLSRGRHASQEQGACVMELASMLAGERFTDHPISVSPVIASILRAYNDYTDDEHRQLLLEYASRTVDTRGSAQLEQMRRERLNTWTLRLRPRWRRLLTDCLSALAPKLSLDTAAALLVKLSAKQDRDGRALTLSIVDELLAIGRDRSRRHGSSAAEEIAVSERPEAGTLDHACVPVPLASTVMEDS